jgi:outer membrane protein OmpA-like peptidoglycan-associated protein
MAYLIFLMSILSGGDIGTTMYPLLKVGLGPRPAAMGESFVGLADDLCAIAWNPSGLAGLREPQFFFSHQEWFLNIRDEYFAAGVPTRNGYLALSALYSSSGSVEIWDEDNEPHGTQNTWSGILTLGYGQRLKDFLLLGLNGKVLVEDLYEQSLADFALDLGARVAINKNLILGSAFKNLSYKTTVPMEFRIGACYQRLKGTNLLLDLIFPADNYIHINFGAEYFFTNYIGLRAGWRSGPYNLAELGWISGLTAGFGIRYRGIKFDYAFIPYGKLGVTHRLSVSGGLGIVKGVNSLTITVMDGETKIPLNGQIEMRGIQAGRYDLNDEGRLVFKNIPSGWAYLTAQAENYPQHYDSIFIYPEGETEKSIYLFKIKPGILRGIVYDAVTKRPIGASLLYQGMAYGTMSNDSLTGSLVIKNLPGGDYYLTVSGNNPRYIPQSCSLTITAGKLTEREFYLVRIREKIILRGVNFETGKAELILNSYPILDEAGKILIDNPDITVEVGGHTDPREINTSEYPSNWELSFARAQIVVKYLIDKFHIDPARLSARGYADTQPIASNDTEAGMAQNRRTEFKILD